jgi:predicted metal-dependent hydrolase
MTAYLLIRSSRTTIQISILPDRTVEVRAPLFAPQQKIDEVVASHESWIQKRITSSSPITTIPVHHAYVAGETIKYLGKPYMLRIATENQKAVSLEGTYIIVQIKNALPEPQRVRSVQKKIEAWQHQQALEVFSEILEKCWSKFSAQYPKARKPELHLRTMKTRWGSLSQSRSRNSCARMTLNTLLICAKPYCIEQVVYHELCHLVHADHSKSFYDTLNLFVSDWKETKEILEATFR